MSNSRPKWMRERLDADNKCYYCQHPMRWEYGWSNSVTQDHMKVKAKGGSGKQSNIVLACRECNQDRGRIPFQDYKQYINAHPPSRPIFAYAEAGAPKNKKKKRNKSAVKVPSKIILMRKDMIEQIRLGKDVSNHPYLEICKRYN